MTEVEARANATFTPVVEYEFNGRKGTMRESFACADARLAKRLAAIACAKFLARLPVPRSFDVVELTRA